MRKRDGVTALARPAEGGSRDPQFITALARGLDVLRAFRLGDGPLANQDIASRTGLPKPTVSRLTYTLSRLGFLDYRPESGRYTLSVGALALGLAALGSLGIRDVARPHMQALADYAGGSVALGTRDRFSMVYVEHCRGPSPVQIALDVGSHIKLATSAMGRAYIAGLPAAERAALMEQLAEREGERWPRLRDGLDEAIENLATRGFTLSVGDWQPEVNAVGVPLMLDTGSLAFALNCGGPAFLMPRQRLIDEFGPRLADIARLIMASVETGRRVDAVSATKELSGRKRQP
jgi:DNA-binding IclR family transcriptional regulator